MTSTPLRCYEATENASRAYGKRKYEPATVENVSTAT